MHILFLTDDLMFASRVQSAAAGLKLEVQNTAPNKAGALEADPNCRLILADLLVLGAAAGQIIPQVKALFPEAKMVGFGPHVDTALLSGAKAAGCDEVLTRGEFQRQYTDLLFCVAKDVGNVE
jgi:DNA-binding NarL/FixJ family response regulator